MKRLTLLPTLLLGLMFLNAAGAQDAQAVLDQILGNLRGESLQATVEMTVTEGDEETNYILEMYSEGEDKALVRVVAPPRQAGQAFLNAGNDLFIYHPRLQRVLRLPPSGRSDSFLGSDLSYNDLSGDDYRDYYIARITETTEDTVTLELTPKEGAPTPYGKLVFTADTGSYAPQELVFYDQRGNPVKRVSYGEYTETDGRRIPTRIEVVDLLAEGGGTVVSFQDYRFGAAIPDSCFTQQALEREGSCN